MIDARLARVAWIACAILASSCARQTVILLPDKEGKETSVVVKQGDREVVLDKPYAAADDRVLLGTRPYTSSAEQVQRQFGTAIAAQPARAMSFTLYFVEGKDELTDESKKIVETLFAEIARRPVADIIVVGHTDAVGTDQFNDALAKQRAEAVRAELVRRGVAPENIQASGRGKRDPLVPTPAGVAEPRNRRVEIVVR